MFTYPHTGLDIETVQYFNSFCGQSLFWDTLGLVFLSTDALRTAILVSIVMGIWEYGRFKNHKESNIRVIKILFSIILTLGIIEILNALIDSPRPIVSFPDLIQTPLLHSDTKILWTESWVRNVKHGSFPSDTVALISSIACGIFLWNRLIGSIAFLFVICVGVLPRLYFGLHYPSDMILGIIIAAMSVFIIEKISLFTNLSKTILKIEEQFPLAFGIIGFYTAYIIADKFMLLRKLPVWLRVMSGS